MPSIRPQYHFRKTSNGLDAFDVRKLIKLSSTLPIKKIDPQSIAELDEDHWYAGGGVPSARSILEHMALIEACDLDYPVILDQQGRLMDGMHRVCKAVIQGEKEILAVQFANDPTPDYINCNPQELPYD